MADEGHASGSPLAISSRTRKELWNSLSLTGNWGNRRLDANGDADYTDEADRDEPSANNSFDKENEWTSRRIDKGGGYHDDLAYTDDATGNLTVENTTIVRGAGTKYLRRIRDSAR